ncbi:acyl-protein thioesterase 1-like isoform X5 [Acanthaster planci]|nr:acyl-protein thioesterase 1-like isoform X5 [Acanthaster planci]XP_022102264.1 acyl-protein thioesterase 1-like isoform X5 [Acanthaster planci]XP_022102265.1 acyl-protein thioesterase 1-like isoform X5 [Acanthaster planci]XP_022102266.1 acyl-protein thioesterase 1-like isoform X5 [Acanthaster planci]
MLLSGVGKHLASSWCCRRPASALSLLTVSFLAVRTLCSGDRGAFMCGNSASSMAKPVIVPAKGSHTASLIFLHGLGDTGHGWASGLEEVVRSAGLHHVKIVCPTAPTIPVTLNMGFRMPAWFDITSLSFDEDQDQDRITESSKLLNNLIDEEEKSGIPSNRIVIGGFSQGGAIALYTALTTERQLGGVLALSTWLPLHTKFPGAFVGSRRDYPVLQCHGDSDPVVNMQYGVMTSTLLKEQFCSNHTFRQYPGLGHSSCPPEMKDSADFLVKVLPSASSKN